ncbi:MAG: VCBS repeat-containing protein, partial [Dysgonamonadaceae bacterium]|nr:VCBS repeat-containing protein [Dysgonamonadaceae bacterium]
NLPDFHTRYSRNYNSYYGIYVSSPNGYRLEENVVAADWDVNADGRPDAYFETSKDEAGNSLAETQRNILYQHPDGSYLPSRISFATDDEFKDALREFMSKQANSMDRFQMFADMPIIGTPVLSNLTKEMDFNKDGQPDLLSDNGVLLNLGNNTFAFAEAPAKIFAKDLNGDFLPDMLLYDDDAQTVTSRIYLGNGEINEQQVLKNFKISDVWCYDFDRDGDVDVLIPLNYQKSIGYAYLVFCENQGEGKFKVHENYYTDKWQFLLCADVNNDGYYDLIAKNELSQYHLFTGKTKFAFNQPAYLFTSSFDATAVYLEDLNNDDVYELATVTKEGLTYIYNFENMPANHAPNKPAAPVIALNRETGKLKISWSAGSDTETSAVDLTYSLRIGSAPGKSDVWFPSANSDGSRLTFTPGNMGSNLDKIVDVSGWNAGNYYISIQTVDPAFRGSAFSGEALYTHEALTPKFTLSDIHLFTVDTLTISLAGSKLAGYSYHWTIPGGQIIEENDHSLKVIFSQEGEKTIALQVTSASGEALPAYEQQLLVKPNKLVKNNSDSSISDFLDLDGNGILDGTGSNGLFANNGQGVFTKIPKLYNSDLTGVYRIGVMDFNLDGLPDITANTNKGGILLNQDDFNFDILNERPAFSPSTYGLQLTTDRLYDFDNDGRMDYCPTRYYSAYIYQNTGDNRRFECSSIYKNEDFVYDWDYDGLWDLFSYNSDTKKLTVRLNKGSFIFEDMEIDLSSFFSDSRISLVSIKDMNNDGFPDLIFRTVCRKYVPPGGSEYTSSYNYSVVFGNNENRYENPVEVISDAGNEFISIQDIDNNGFPDLIMYQESYVQIVYFYPDGEVKVNRNANKESVSLYQASEVRLYQDLNGDHTPDFSSGVHHQTKITNTPPQAPIDVRARQTETGLLIEWVPARDAETPYTQMRYNVSVRKKNTAVGDEDAFIVSPLNGLKDEAAIVPLLAYRNATRMEIPMERIPAGAYEIQVQSIDLWNAHSPMSLPFTIETSSQIGIQASSYACINVPVTILAHSSETQQGAIVWDWDGGTVVSGSGAGPYQVQWSVPGIKTVKASINGATVSTAIVVGEGESYDLTFSLPAIVLADVEVNFELPEILMNPAMSYHFNTSNRNISVIRRTGTRECKVVFPASGGEYQWIELQVETSGCASPV